MFSTGRILFAALLLAGLAGCASMNKSECLNADWHMIGLEDGSQGRPVSHIGKHRKACADYNFKPDLDAYEAGHAAGREQYCTESNGFRLGKRGGFYSGVCAGELKENFLTGYDAGKKVNSSGMAARQAANAVKSNRAKLENLKQETKAKEAQLVSSKMTEMARVHLLEETREDELKVAELEAQLPGLEKDREEKQGEYEEMQKLYPYGCPLHFRELLCRLTGLTETASQTSKC